MAEGGIAIVVGIGMVGVRILGRGTGVENESVRGRRIDFRHGTFASAFLEVVFDDCKEAKCSDGGCESSGDDFHVVFPELGMTLNYALFGANTGLDHPRVSEYVRNWVIWPRPLGVSTSDI